MSQLFVLSFDCLATPALSASESLQVRQQKNQTSGWGLAWYPKDLEAAIVIKDAGCDSQASIRKAIRDWEEFQSTVYLGYMKGAAKGRSQQETQPFRRTFAKRDWVFSHLGDLSDPDYQQKLILSQNPAFEPISQIDSEHIFCWILSQVDKKRARSLFDFGYAELFELFKFANGLGSVNIVLSDGEDIVVFQDKKAQIPFFYNRITPPITDPIFQLEDIRIRLDTYQDIQRTFCLISTQPLKKPLEKKLEGGQMVVLRRGKIYWDCQAEGFQTKPDFFYYPKEKIKSVETIQINHKTIYEYTEQVGLSKHYLRLHPINDALQKVLEHKVHISVPHQIQDFEDVFGNKVSFIKISENYKRLEIQMYTKVELKWFAFVEDPKMHFQKTIPLVWMPWQRQMMSAYLLPPELPESELLELKAYAMSFVERNHYELLQLLLDINKTIYKDFKYASGSTHLYTTPYEVYKNRQGVCQDFANLFICLARLLSIPARYRVGYLFTGGRYDNTIQSDASHAWVEIYLPWAGWVGFDPTNGCLANQDHVRVACGRTFYDATPTSGTLYKGGGDETLSIEVQVTTE